jgi:hypothetical protein
MPSVDILIEAKKILQNVKYDTQHKIKNLKLPLLINKYNKYEQLHKLS